MISLDAIPYESRKTVTDLVARLSNPDAPELPPQLRDTSTEYAAVHSTLCVLSVFEQQGMERHVANLVNEALSHLDRLQYEHELVCFNFERRLKEKDAEIARLKAAQ